MKRVLAEELRFIVISIGAGALLLLLYDVQHTLRSPLAKWLRKLWDLLFVLSAAVWLFGLCLRLQGEVRLSFFAFLGAGCVAYALVFRRWAGRVLGCVAKWEAGTLERGRNLWKKILFSAKKCFAKYAKSFTIKRQVREDEQGTSALRSSQLADAHSVRTTYAAERVGRNRERGAPAAKAPGAECRAGGE